MHLVGFCFLGQIALQLFDYIFVEYEYAFIGNIKGHSTRVYGHINRIINHDAYWLILKCILMELLEEYMFSSQSTREYAYVGH